jgi:hypothetical protein
VKSIYYNPIAVNKLLNLTEFVNQLKGELESTFKEKLPNRNVASRVLPVRIHDLDNENLGEVKK